MRARHGVGARRRSGTWPFRSAPCLLKPAGGQRPIVRSIHPVTAAAPPTCGYVDNESALPTYPQDQKTTKVSVNFDRLKAQQSDPVHHNPDRQPGQPPHPSPHSVSILAAIHTRFVPSCWSAGSRYDKVPLPAHGIAEHSCQTLWRREAAAGHFQTRAKCSRARIIAGLSGFLTFIQSRDGPDR